ncbi:MAG TPA: DUF1559 domain-containing protein [Pirellulaceae bacterium]|jgi:hypothetical protein|nr:DUF1559 domain-containing protein [Pirellulaceae bacterium]
MCGSSVAFGAGLSLEVEPLPPRQTAAPKAGWGSILLQIAVVLLIVGVLVTLLAQPVLSGGRGEASRTACSNNLKQLAVALHIYHERYGALPAQCVTDENGRPMHSWRVALLPFLEESKLYDDYDFEQPWDSSYNRAVCEVPIDLFSCPRAAVSEGGDFSLTNYFVVTGDGTMFGPDRWTKFSDVTDGLSNTIMIVECNSPDFRVKWYEPRDIPFDEMEFKLNPPRGIGVSSAHPGVAHVALADGSVRSVAGESVGESAFRYLLIRNDGMPVQIP